jgi:hypothetical protein
LKYLVSEKRLLDALADDEPGKYASEKGRRIKMREPSAGSLSYGAHQRIMKKPQLERVGAHVIDGLNERF